MQARRWFTFFWIPLIPLKIIGEYIECSSCQSTYEPRVLDMPTTAHVEDQLTRALRHVVVAMMHADGHIDDRELKAIQQAGRGLGMSPAHVRGVLAEITETAGPSE